MTRARRFAVQSLALALLLALGWWCHGLHTAPHACVYWTGWLVLTGVWLWCLPLRGLAARWRMEARLRAALPGAGGEQKGLVVAALAIKEHHEERALDILDNLTVRSRNPEVAKARRWLAALAGARWLARQSPSRPLSWHHRSPQLHALVFGTGMMCVPLREEPVLRELAEASSRDLDELAQDYISLMDMLVASLESPAMPFSIEAEDLLAFVTGRAYLVGARDRFGAWWKATRPVFVRGGGALLVGIRLLQRESYSEAAKLLTGLAEGGLLSAEADTLRRAAQFLALFARPQWRMTSADIPRYFTQGQYFLALEMGVLRFPTAGLQEVTNACRMGKILRDGKRRLIEDTLGLWDVFEAELAPHLALLLKRLLEDKSRHCSTRVSYWRRQWAERQAAFEQPIAALMDGIVATAAGRLKEAAQHFEEAARLEPQLSVPLVNLVYVKLQAGKVDAARSLARVIEKGFPKDGYALIALGRLFVTQLEDTTEAERLFLKARDRTDPPTEALICLGEVKLMEGLYMEAQAYFEHARQADPALPDPRLGLARTYMETRNFKHAIEHLNAVVKSGPDEARDMACYLLYRTYREAGDDKHAFQCLDKVPQRFFTEPDILDDIAGHLESSQQYAKAREFAVRAMILRASGHGRANDADALNAM